MKQVVVLEQDQEFVIPNNCWAFIEKEDGKKVLVTGKVTASQRTRLVLVPKIAGG